MVDDSYGLGWNTQAALRLIAIHDVVFVQSGIPNSANSYAKNCEWDSLVYHRSSY
jgi:hypothetical protein